MPHQVGFNPRVMLLETVISSPVKYWRVVLTFPENGGPGAVRHSDTSLTYEGKEAYRGWDYNYMNSIIVQSRGELIRSPKRE